MATEAQENFDLAASSKPHGNGNETQGDSAEPPDGGWRAYVVVAGSFLINGLIFGVINSYSVIYTVLEKRLKDQGGSHSESRASLVGALTISMTFLLSPLSGVLTGILGIRSTAVLGGVIASAGVFVSSFLTDSVNALSFTYGIMFGMGAALAYTPCLAILGHYFKKFLGLANGIVAIGCSVFTVIMPPIMEYTLKNYGLAWLFRGLALLVFGIALCGLLLKPLKIEEAISEDNSCISQLKNAISTEIWCHRNYRIWALSTPIALCGYYVPYVHIKKLTMIMFTGVNFNLPLQCIAITSGVGPLVFGFIADRPGSDKIVLLQLAFYMIGLITIILPFVSSFPIMVALTLGMGIFDGGFSALIAPIAIELTDSSNAANAIGCVLGLVATPLSIGPPIAGYLYEIHKSYKLPFLLAGICPLIGASLMFTIRKRKTRANGRDVAVSSAGADSGNSLVLLTKGKIRSED